MAGDSLVSTLKISHPQKTHACVLSHFSRVRLFATPWTVAHKAALSMGFFRQEYWSGLPFPPPLDLLNPGIETASFAVPALQENSLPLNHEASPLCLLCVCAKLLQSCPTLCDPMDCSPQGSSVHGIFLGRILEWVAISYSKGSSQDLGRSPGSSYSRILSSRDKTHAFCVSCITSKVDCLALSHVG